MIFNWVIYEYIYSFNFSLDHLYITIPLLLRRRRCRRRRPDLLAHLNNSLLHAHK